MRYCRPQHVNDGKPAATAFVRNPDHCDLSVFRLQGYVTQARSDAVDCIRDEAKRNLRISPRGRFAVFNVGKAKRALETEELILDASFTPSDTSPSHSSITGLPSPNISKKDAMRAGALLMRLLDGIYPGLSAAQKK